MTIPLQHHPECNCPECGELLFVYGTLKKNGSAHDKLGQAILVDSAACVPGILIPMGWYPAMVPHGECRVFGEIYRVPKTVIPDLDHYEGVDRGLYARVKYTTAHKPYLMWVYRYAPVISTSETTLVIDKGHFDVKAAKQTCVPLSSLRSWFEKRDKVIKQHLIDTDSKAIDNAIQLDLSDLLPKPEVSTLPAVVAPAVYTPYRWNEHLLPPQEMS